MGHLSSHGRLQGLDSFQKNSMGIVVYWQPEDVMSLLRRQAILMKRKVLWNQDRCGAFSKMETPGWCADGTLDHLQALLLDS